MEKKKSAKDIFIEQQESEIAYQDNILSAQQELSQPMSNNVGFGLSQTNTATPSMAIDSSRKKSNSIQINMLKTSEELQNEKEPIKVKITGIIFKKVIVPPNAYVVHTRINKKNPVTIGLGVSFRYNPDTDAYLIVPAAMQTIGVVAKCITKEKQGINILAYVQWQIADFSIAYKKLDFSDPRDPLGIVNAQLREQAEAAIKDKIATISVEEVLTDKEPVIKELTARLKTVAEGQGNYKDDEGLGIKITTVQIREALVSSTSLWEDLQSPFRHEQKKKSSISLLEMQNEIKKKELESRKQSETNEAETNLEIELIKQKKNTETIELKFREETIRFEKEQENIQNKYKLEEQTVLSEKMMQDRILEKENEIQHNREIENLRLQNLMEEQQSKILLEKKKREIATLTEEEIFEAEEKSKKDELFFKLKTKWLDWEKTITEKESELNILTEKQNQIIENLKTKTTLDKEKSVKELEIELETQRVNIEKARMEIGNLVNSNVIFQSLIEVLPNIAERMPEIKELKILQTGESDPLINNLTSFISKFMSLSDSLGIKVPFKKEKEN
ncbi:MAG TPA: SPFH domain-containing protein [Spirochaetota bacterium]|nr:SPFH domain-containing protein [Spirochaetota bacterium]